MKVKITNPPGALSDEGGMLVVPKKGEEIDVTEEVGRGMVDSGHAEEVGAASEGTPNASANAASKASELGVDLAGIRGTGANGQITVPDVEKAAREEADEERQEDEPSETTASNGPSETR